MVELCVSPVKNSCSFMIIIIISAIFFSVNRETINNKFFFYVEILADIKVGLQS